MKNFIPREVKKWFGYDRKERRASSILIILIMIVLAIKFMMPGSNMDVVDMTPEVQASLIESPGAIFDPGFVFDPNHASFDTLIKAGLDEKQARTLINYRTKGGRFRKPSDIFRLYGIDSQKAALLIPSVRIQDDTSKLRHAQKKIVELNSCDSAALESLPGIGPVLSVRIIRYRNLLGGYVSVDQLKEVYGLPAETFDLICKRVMADTSLVKKVNINTADYKLLSRLPYLKKYHYTDILKFRELEGGIKNIDELVRNNIIPDSLAWKIRPYLVF